MPARRTIRTLSLLLTEQCNLSCRYCYRSKGLEGRMSVVTLRRAIDILLSSGDSEPTILFTGGEPLLALPLVRAGVRHARRNQRDGQRVRLQLATNGTRLTPEALEFLVAHEVKVQLSFDGVPAAQRSRGRETFTFLDRLLPRVRRAHPHFYRRRLVIGMVLTPETIPHLAASIEYFLSHRVSAIRLGSVMPRRAALAPELYKELEAQFARLTVACLRHHDRTGETPLGLFHEPRDDERPRRPGPSCGATQGDTMAVDPSGMVWACPIFANGDFTGAPRRRAEVERFRLGPIAGLEWRARLVALPRAVAGRGVLRARAWGSSRARCAECAWASTCGICPASLMLCEEPDGPGRVPDLPCALHRVAAQHREIYRGRSSHPRRSIGR